MITINKKKPEINVGRSIIYVDGQGLPYHGVIVEAKPGDGYDQNNWQVVVEYASSCKMAPGGLLLIDHLKPRTEDNKRTLRVVRQTYSEHCSNLWPNLKQYLNHMLVEYIRYLAAKGRAPSYNHKLTTMLHNTFKIVSKKAEMWDRRMRLCSSKAMEWFKANGIEYTINPERPSACLYASYSYKRHMEHAPVAGLEPFDVTVSMMWIQDMSKGWMCYESDLRKGWGSDPIAALIAACARMEKDTPDLKGEADMLRETFKVSEYKPEDWRLHQD